MSGNSLAAMVKQGQKTTQERQRAPKPAPVGEERKPFGTRVRPSLHRYAKTQAVEMEVEVGHAVRIEDLFDALLEEFRENAELRAQVAARLREG